MPTNSSQKGARAERELVNTLTACGFAAMRCPASGAATDRDLPDVLAMRPVAPTPRPPRAEVLAIEVKATAGTTAYADASEIGALTRFADAAGATAYLAGRFDRDRNYYLVEPRFARVTDEAGRYGVPQADAEQRAGYVVDASVGEVRES